MSRPILLLLLVLCTTFAPAFAAGQWYVTIVGSKSGKFPSEATGNLREGKIMVIAMSHEIVSPRDRASGMPTGKRQHGAITFVKEWGPASPMLHQALSTNETLTTVLLEYIETDALGRESITSSIKLTNAHVVSSNNRWSIGPTSPAVNGNGQACSFTYQKIEWTYGKITHEDSWEAQK